MIPKELLKFRLDKQLFRLKQIFSEPSKRKESVKVDEEIEIEIEIEVNLEEELGEEDKFQLYQRVLSWFIMGRLAKSEFDGIFENLLNTSELIEIHNRVIELLRAIYCDSPSSNCTVLASKTTGLSAVGADSLKMKISKDLSDSIEIDLLPLEELDWGESDHFKDLNEEEQQEDLLRNFDFNFRARRRTFDTSISTLGLTTSDEAMISEAMRNPIHDIASYSRSALIPGIDYRKGFDTFDGGSRQCIESFKLPDQDLMKQRFMRVGSNGDFVIQDSWTISTISDSIAVLACKSLEDYMKNILENVASLKFGHQPLLRPPISYMFPNSIAPAESENGSSNSNSNSCYLVNREDLTLLFKLKPWLLSEMESDVMTLSDDFVE